MDRFARSHPPKIPKLARPGWHGNQLEYILILSEEQKVPACGVEGVRLTCRTFTGAIVLCSAQPAFAQFSASAGEIVVTAQRRPELPQDVPISVLVRSGEELEQFQVTDSAALARTVPSLTMTRSGAFTQPFLRGVGKRSTLGVENSVATYVDGVYLASSISALLDLRGIERVEVLNGPQGTLFGRNTSAGVIQIITRDPTAEAHSEVALHAGTYGYARGDAYLTGGSDRLAGNVALSLSRSGGYGTNLFTGATDQGEVDHQLVARSKWLLQAGGSWQVTFAADYQDIEQDFSQRPAAGFPPVGEPRITDFRDGDQDASNRYHFRYGGALVRADAAIGGLPFVSLTAIRRMRARYNNDLDLGPLPLLSGHPSANQKQFSQEFQLHSSERSRLRWIAGLFYIRLEERYEPTLFLYGGSFSTRLGGRVRQSLTDTGRVSSYAAYGQATWRIGDRTRLTTGLRQTIEDRSVEAQGQQEFAGAPFVRPIPGLPLPTQPPFRNSKTFRALTWRASLDTDFSNRWMGYLSASRGFQSGGWNLQTPQVQPFAPETLDAIEAGVKYVDRSGRLRAEAAAFAYDYSDLQVSAFTPLGSLTTNATSADIYGLELQLTAELGRTRILLGAQLLETAFGRFPNATCIDLSPAATPRYGPRPCDATGNRLPFAPAFKANVSVRQELALGGAGGLTLAGNLAYNSGYFAEADNVARQHPFATLDVSIEWRPVPAGPSVQLWARNLTDARYSDSLANFPTTGILQRPAAPQRFGLSVAYAR